MTQIQLSQARFGQVSWHEQGCLDVITVTGKDRKRFPAILARNPENRSDTESPKITINTHGGTNFKLEHSGNRNQELTAPYEFIQAARLVVASNAPHCAWYNLKYGLLKEITNLALSEIGQGVKDNQFVGNITALADVLRAAQKK
jgi:hypothetical protein